MKNLLLLPLILLSSLAGTGQDPSCEYILSLGQVNDSLYRYLILIEDDYDRQEIEVYVKQLEQGKRKWENRNCALLEDPFHGQMLVLRSRGYCYPNGQPDQLRVTVIRQHKEKATIESMHSYASAHPFVTEIQIGQFVEGQRPNTVYEYKKRYGGPEPQEYNQEAFRTFNKRVMVWY